jgi:glycosyl transferase family 25
MKYHYIVLLTSTVIAIVIASWVAVHYYRKPTCSSSMLSKSLLAGADVYLINLDRHKDRLKFFKKQFDKSDLSTIIPSFIRMSATDAKEIDWRSYLSKRALKEVDELQTTGYRRSHYQLTPGAVGCYLSHWRAWQAAAATPAEKVLIFEDDAVIPRYLCCTLLNTSPPPPDFDIILLSRFCVDCKSVPDYPEWVRVHRFFSTAGYIVSRNGLLKLLAMQQVFFPISLQIDTAMMFAAKPRGTLNIYALKRGSIVTQSTQFATSIQAPLRSPANSDEAWYVPPMS